MNPNNLLCVVYKIYNLAPINWIDILMPSLPVGQITVTDLKIGLA